MISLEQLAVRPKRWTLTPHKGGRAGARRMILAVVMPRPTLTGREPCADDDRFIDYAKHRTEDLAELCAMCPVLHACREWAIAHDDHNYTGGTTPLERKRIRAEREQAYVEPHNAAIWGLDHDHFWSPPTRCKAGHEISTNTANVTRAKNGRILHVCTVCSDSTGTAGREALAHKRKGSA